MNYGLIIAGIFGVLGCFVATVLIVRKRKWSLVKYDSVLIENGE